MDVNPFRLQELNPDGPYIMGHERCTDRRKEYLKRGNRILATYSTVATFSNLGLQHINSLKKSNDTHFRLAIGARFIQSNYLTLKNNYPKAMVQLTNQTVAMIYGNLEAYIVDIAIDSFQALGINNAQQETLRLLAIKGWAGKIDSIGQKFNVKLGKRYFMDKFRSIPLEFQGKSYSNPIEFLQIIADIRHLILHSAGRIDDRLANETGLKSGDEISFPVELPFDLHIFLVTFSDVFDKAFSDRFGWTRQLVQPEHLVGI